MKFTLVTGLALAAMAAAVEARQFEKPTIVPNKYIIELDTSGGSARSAFTASAQKFDHNVKVHHEYDSPFFTGVSVQFQHPKDVTAYLQETKVKSIYPVRLYTRGVPIRNYHPKGIQPDLYAAHNLTGVNLVHNDLGYTGKGIKVGIIDTGIYWPHPAFGSCFKTPGCRVAYGYDLVGDNYGIANQTEVPDPDPLDNCSGDSHGTHVAGIIGANATHITPAPAVPFLGVAPDVTLGAYRVFGCPADSTGDDVIIAALIRAADDGMDMINLSLGGASGWSEAATSVVADRITRAGHIVLAAAGNDGGLGVSVVGAPGTTLEGFGVGSMDNLQVLEYTIFDSKNNTYGYAPGLKYNNGAPFPDVYSQIVPSNETGCSPFTMSFSGKVALIPLSTCGTITQCKNVRLAGGTGCLVYDTVAGSISINGDNQIPNGAIDLPTAQRMLARLSANPTEQWFLTKQQSPFNLSTAGTPSSFTSLGPDGELNMKPQICGVGGDVYSTLSQKNGYYGTLSGTSMATPYVAGSLALYLQAKGLKAKTSKQLKIAFQNNAKPAVVYGTESLAPVLQQGAGLVNVYDTILAETSVYPSAFSLNDTVHMKSSYTLQITNNGKKSYTYILDARGAGTVYDFAQGDDMPLQKATLTDQHARVLFSRNVFTIAPKQTKSVKVYFRAPSGADASKLPFFSGFITIEAQGSNRTAITIPYQGVKGSWKNAPIINKVSATSQTIVLVNSDETQIIDTPQTYNISQGLYVLFPIATPSRIVKGELIPKNANNGNPIGYLVGGSDLQSYAPFYITYVPRNTAVAGQSEPPYWTFQWTGAFSTDMNGQYVYNVQNGEYQLKISGLKHFGNPKSAGDWDTWTSVALNITV